MLTDTLLTKGLVPDTLIRQGIRRLLHQRLRDEQKSTEEAQQAHLMQFVETLKKSPIAIETTSANEQHYEVPTEFYRYVLGKNMKYSSGYWEPSTLASPSGGRGRSGAAAEGLDASEEAMLELTCQRAELTDGQDVLELGCGWGSLSLFMAQRYPKSRIKAVSNSRTQKLYIDEQASQRGLANLEIITADMNRFEIQSQFDRVVSVEMFEHMRNYEKLMAKVSSWLKPGGKLFIHIFTHKEFAYPFEVKDDSDWMSRYFFTGGIMPSDHLLLYFQNELQIQKHWRVDGTHYQRTSEAWLSRMDKHRREIFPIFEKTYGVQDAMKWWVYWRIFFMSCAELWGFRGGTEWFVSHYLFHKK